MANVFDDFAFDQFWKPSAYAEREYVDTSVTDELVAAVERELGYTLPASYVEFMRHQNGGIPKKTCHWMDAPTTWASDHIAIHGMCSIGREKRQMRKRSINGA
jgi:hypothetical protein